MFDRRQALNSIALAALAVAQSSLAQQTGRVYRVGILRPTAQTQDIQVTLLPQALRDIGYVEGQNLVIERRYAANNLDSLPRLAKQLVDLRMDVIVAIAAPAISAAKEATSSIPIVFFGNFDPVAAGFVDNLARPGGNITGIVIAPDGTLAAKKVELLTQAVPRVRRVAMLLPDDPTVNEQLTEVRKAASMVGVELAAVEVRNGDYADAFSRIATVRADALFVAATSYFVIDRKLIIELASKYRLPAIYEWPEQVEDGGLMAYGPSSLVGANRRTAAYVDLILKGARAGDLPIERPLKLELVINRKTAKSIGLTIPHALLLRADRVIE